MRVPSVRFVVSVLIIISIIVAAWISEVVLEPVLAQSPLAAFRGHVRGLRSRSERVYPSLGVAPGLAARRQASVLEVSGKEIVPVANVSKSVIPRLGFSTSTQYAFADSATDEYGFVNPPGSWGLQRVDAVLLGGSLAVGSSASKGRSFATALRLRFSNVLQAAPDGAGPLLQLGALKEFAAPMKPKLVFWCFFEGSDFEALSTEMTNPILRNYLQRGFSQNLKSRIGESDQALSQFFDSMLPPRDAGSRRRRRWRRFVTLPAVRAAARQAVRPALESLGLGPKGYVDPGRIEGLLPIFEEAISEAKKTVEATGGNLIFVAIPSRVRYYAPGRYSDKGYNAVLGTVRKLAVPIIDISLSISDSGLDPKVLYPSPALSIEGYPNDAGHMLVATELGKAIEYSVAQEGSGEAAGSLPQESTSSTDS